MISSTVQYKVMGGEEEEEIEGEGKRGGRFTRNASYILLLNIFLLKLVPS